MEEGKRVIKESHFLTGSIVVTSAGERFSVLEDNSLFAFLVQVDPDGVELNEGSWVAKPFLIALEKVGVIKSQERADFC